MALTYTKTALGQVENVVGDLKLRLVEYDCTKYNSSGVPVTAAELGLADVVSVMLISSENARAFTWVRSTGTIHAYVLTTAAEVADDADLGTFVVQVLGH